MSQEPVVDFWSRIRLRPAIVTNAVHEGQLHVGFAFLQQLLHLNTVLDELLVVTIANNDPNRQLGGLFDNRRRIA